MNAPPPRRRRPARRSYTLGLRGEAVAERRVAILEAAYRLLLHADYDDVSLELVAREAGVSVKTVTRQFGTKDVLVVEAVRHHTPREHAQRAVPPGDVDAVVEVLAARYEQLGAMTYRAIAIEERIPAVAEALAMARADHRAWLAEVFARWLPARRPKLVDRRLAQLFGVTEIYVWYSWRVRLGMTVERAAAAMHGSLTALIRLWDRDEEA